MGPSGMLASTSSSRSVIFFSMEISTRRILSQRSKWAPLRNGSMAWSWLTSSIRRTRRLRRRLSPEMMRRYCFSFSGGMAPSKMASVYPAMVVMGVFSSWEMLAINSRRCRSVCWRDSAMALKEAASSPTSSFLP